jgi:transcriptional regulator with XRE-family HTH domain
MNCMDLTRKADRTQLGARMHELRTEYGLTQQECADALGVAQNTYAQMESGAIRFRRRDLVTLAVLYGLSLEDAFPMFGGRVAA